MAGMAFDIDGFLSKHGIRVSKDYSSGQVRKIVLAECPFDSNHKAPDSAIFVLNNGAIGFKCLHNSCSHRHWQDVREFYEPDAYAKKSDSTRTISPHRKIELPEDDMPIIEEIQGAKFLQLSDIKNVDRSMMVSIPTGFINLDRYIIGLNKGETSLVSGV